MPSAIEGTKTLIFVDSQAILQLSLDAHDSECYDVIESRKLISKLGEVGAKQGSEMVQPVHPIQTGLGLTPYGMYGLKGTYAKLSSGKNLPRGH